MKKRSMFAIASLAAGFVVAAVTPSHAATGPLGGVDVEKALGTVGKTLGKDSLSMEDSPKDKAKEAKEADDAAEAADAGSRERD
ncbi:hypothetical protein [Streptomyces flavalbus]|uniref:Secreted protein n=1 Tax=Streptomyces flavalbus TaxID=2665155 RepID=A0ABW2W1I2_9ACTN